MNPIPSDNVLEINNIEVVYNKAVQALRGLSLVVPRGQGKSLKTSVTRQDPLLAPLNKGQTLATLKITLSGQPWQDMPLTALDAVPSAGWMGRAWDAIRLGVQ